MEAPSLIVSLLAISDLMRLSSYFLSSAIFNVALALRILEVSHSARCRCYCPATQILIALFGKVTHFKGVNLSNAFFWFARHGLPLVFRKSAFRKYCRRNRGTGFQATCQLGYKMDIVIGDTVDNHIGVYGIFEEATTKVISSLAGKCSSFVDIGCNIGYYACLFAHENPLKPLIAVDPNPLMSSRTQANLDLNKAQNVTVLDQGIGSEAGNLELNIPENRHSLASFAYVPERGGDCRPVTARVTTLSHVLDEYPMKDIFIKIDTEGFELNVFKGLEDRHVADISFILFELAGLNLKQAGYTPVELLGLPIFQQFHFYLVDDHAVKPLSKIENPSFEEDVNVNILLVRKEGPGEVMIKDVHLVA